LPIPVVVDKLKNPESVLSIIAENDNSTIVKADFIAL
jgi:hypothetical protein